ncbi:MAG: orotidine 5'-phosphate decarboxylase [Candidatus Korarchaeum sp.]|nr:orotidine 5'-phosphate decarboxylase [Candidatus Korarchaeum sp.]MDW8036351.1 orotidine 5'-phosphate decarboxylase / HUMPS family protein [Candidatus Korarchaeum sp.]
MPLEVFLSLDLIYLEEALNIAEKAHSVGFRNFEVGTPLIKSVGMISVRRLKDEFPEAVIFADTKTMDTGYLEAQLAFSAGADIMSVMAVAPDETIKEALKKAREEGKEVLADTLGSRELESRVVRLVELGVDRICIHKGVDEGIFSEYEVLDRMKSCGVKLGIAGGIGASTIREIVSKVDFVMVGRAVTKAPDPKRAAEEILKAAFQ